MPGVLQRWRCVSGGYREGAAYVSDVGGDMGGSAPSVSSILIH